MFRDFVRFPGAVDSEDDEGSTPEEPYQFVRCATCDNTTTADTTEEPPRYCPDCPFARTIVERVGGADYTERETRSYQTA